MQTDFDEKMLPFVRSDLEDGPDTDMEDEMFSAIEDRIDDFLDSEGVFVSHVDDAKQALFAPFVATSRYSHELPARSSSINLGK